MRHEETTPHISRRFGEELEGIRNMVLTMGGLVEKHTGDAIDALVNGDSKLGDVIAKSDYKVNALEVAIDEEYARILALSRLATNPGEGCGLKRWRKYENFVDRGGRKSISYNCTMF